MQKPKKIPLRKCIGCGEMKPKRELTRVVKSPEGVVSIDMTGRAAGRGAYVCHDPGCLRAARKARRLERAFSCRIEDAVYDGMEEVLLHEHGE